MTMISACGVICSDCPAYQGSTKGTAHQDRVVEAWHRIYKLNMTPDRITCGGCLGSDKDLFYTMGDCQARRCCLSKGFKSCAECPDQACADLEKAQSTWDEVPQLIDKLSAQEFETNARPYCDHRLRLRAMRLSLNPQGD